MHKDSTFNKECMCVCILVAFNLRLSSLHSNLPWYLNNSLASCKLSYHTFSPIIYILSIQIPNKVQKVNPPVKVRTKHVLPVSRWSPYHMCCTPFRATNSISSEFLTKEKINPHFIVYKNLQHKFVLINLDKKEEVCFDTFCLVGIWAFL